MFLIYSRVLAKILNPEYSKETTSYQSAVKLLMYWSYTIYFLHLLSSQPAHGIHALGIKVEKFYTIGPKRWFLRTTL